MKDKVRPLLEAAAKDYVPRASRLAEAHRALRQVVVTLSALVLRRARTARSRRGPHLLARILRDGRSAPSQDEAP